MFGMFCVGHTSCVFLLIAPFFFVVLGHRARHVPQPVFQRLGIMNIWDVTPPLGKNELVEDNSLQEASAVKAFVVVIKAR